MAIGLPGEAAQFNMAPPGRKQAFINPDKPPRQAAVLIPVVINPGDNPLILLTLRKIYDGVHSGQVSFPGGKFDEGETDPVEVALREAREEVGIRPEDVTIVGKLSPLFIPPSNMFVYPVVGVLQSDADWEVHPDEVEEIIRMPFRCFTDECYRSEINFVNVSGEKISAPCYRVDRHPVWGATAMIISEFSEVLCRAGFNGHSA